MQKQFKAVKPTGKQSLERVGPQLGPQQAFYLSDATITIYGGAAGGGKSAGLLLRAARHVRTPTYRAVIFRRTYPQIRNEGGLWDASGKYYPYLGSSPRESDLEWAWSNGATVRFAHLQHEKNKLDWQGAEIDQIGFDELTHFTEDQFWYLLSRSRSTSGLTPEINATTNPEPGWVKNLIDWWIGEDGYAIPERSCVARWFIRDGDSIKWAGTREELQGEQQQPLSLRFIAAKLEDNPLLLQADPLYRSKLLALPTVERERLLMGNWKIKSTQGRIFEDFTEDNLCDSSDWPRDRGQLAFDDVRLGHDAGDVNPFLVVCGRRGPTWYELESAYFGDGKRAVRATEIEDKAAELCQKYGVRQCRVPPERPQLILDWQTRGVRDRIPGLANTVKAYNKLADGNAKVNSLFGSNHLRILRSDMRFRQDLSDYHRAKDRFGNYVDEPAPGQQDHSCDGLRYCIVDPTPIPYSVTGSVVWG